MKEILKSGALSKNELAFIGCFINFISPNTNEVKIDGEHITLDLYGKMINVGKNTISSVLDDLEAHKIIKVIKRHKMPPIVYFNPYLIKSSEEINKETYSVFVDYTPDYGNKIISKNNLNTTKGEKKIQHFLTNSCIQFKEQYKFDQCKHTKELRFDFAVFDKNDLKYLIEYDGEHHFMPISAFGGDSEYEETKKRDKIKNEFCKNNNVELYRIPYWKYDEIESILSKLTKNQPLEVDKTSFLIV